MPAKKDLRAQVNSLSLAGQEEDYFDAPVLSERTTPTPPRGLKPSPYQSVLLPSKLLVEYEDKNFEEITGRPQPFREYDPDEMDDMIASVGQHGVLEPITVRPFGDGLYQIIAGRHRNRASVANGFTEVPGIIREDIDDVEAALIMLDTNLKQRHNLTYSEKAWAYRMERDLKKQQGKRTDLEKQDRTLCTECTKSKIDTLSDVGKKNKDSRRTVAYLIQLTYLIPELLEMVDRGKLGYKVGAKISELTPRTQIYLLEHILPIYGKIGISQAKQISDLDDNGEPAPEDILAIFQKKVQQSFSVSRKKLADFSDLASSNSEFEQLVVMLLTQYRDTQQKGA